MSIAITNPASFIIFGGCGDLTWRKLLPALYNLHINQFLPEKFAIVCVDYISISDIDFKKHILEGINNFSRSGKAESNAWDAFSTHITYQQGDFNNEDCFINLGNTLKNNDEIWGSTSIRLFYYAVSPKFIQVISESLSKHQLANDIEHNRIIIEKPFGTNYETAKALNQLLSTHFNEKQIYRIDHYLGKEPVQNMLAFRFANTVFEPIWNRNFIDHVQITVAENIGISNRGGYYDQSGALRDMVQNHLMQLLCLAAMEPPVSYTPEEIRDNKVDVLKSVRVYTDDVINNNVVRGQYDSGEVNGVKLNAYRAEANVNPQSNTETFVAAKFFIDNWRWQDCPFYLRTGKNLKLTSSIIAVQFKPVPHNIFPANVLQTTFPNRLIISIQPEMKTTLLFYAKQPGLKLKISPVEMDFTYQESYKAPAPEAYETLLLDALEGDATLFMRADQVEAAWKIVMPILDHWQKNTPTDFPNYKAGSAGPNCADDLILKDGFEWILLPNKDEIKNANS